MKGEPLYGEKGKHSGLTYNHCDIDPPDTCNHTRGHPSSGTFADAASKEDLETTVYSGLNQPRLLASNSVALGEAKNQMQRENKQRRQVLRAEQPLISPWAQHQGLMDTITPTDHAACPPHRNSMCPNPKWASAPTPRGRFAQGMGHIWVPHPKPASHGRRKRCGRQLPGVRTAQPDHPRQLHILKQKLRQKNKQIKRSWCYGTPSKTTPQRSSKYLQLRPFHTNPRIFDLSWTYHSNCALGMEGYRPQ